MADTRVTHASSQSRKYDPATNWNLYVDMGFLLPDPWWVNVASAPTAEDCEHSRKAHFSMYPFKNVFGLLQLDSAEEPSHA